MGQEPPARPTFGSPPPRDDLKRLDPAIHLVSAGAELWRIHFRSGDHPTLWNEYRFFGPIERNRFDHQIEPVQAQDRGIMYVATSIPVCLAEVFQRERNIDRRRNAPWLAAFRTIRTLTLVDLTGIWPTRAGASQEINSGDRRQAREWSRAIYEAYPAVAGLWYRSKMHGGNAALALYERADVALPPTPSYHAALRSISSFDGLRNIAVQIGYDLS